MSRLNEKVAVITGGAGGIGKATAEHFLKEGAKVVLVDLFQEPLDEAQAELESLGEVITVAADVSKEEDVKKYVKETVDKFGKVDIFFNNAGIEGEIALLTDLAVEDFDKVINVNVRGVFLGLKHVLPVMREQGSGSVINMSSGAGLMGTPNQIAYGASKHAVTGMTKTAALEIADANVRVNSIHPAPINTRMMRSIEEGTMPGKGAEAQEAFTSIIPIGRYGESEDIANLVMFLASDDSAFISGSQYRIDGGLGAK